MRCFKGRVRICGEEFRQQGDDGPFERTPLLSSQTVLGTHPYPGTRYSHGYLSCDRPRPSLALPVRRPKIEKKYKDCGYRSPKEARYLRFYPAVHIVHTVR